MPVAVRSAARARGCPPGGMARPGHGFTLIEVLVALTVMVVLAAVITPALVTGLDRARVNRAHETLVAVDAAITAFAEDVVSGGVGGPFGGGGTARYPSSLLQLDRPIGNPAQDLCGDNFTNADRNAWAGPYLQRTVPLTGIPAGIGLLQPGFTYVPASGGNGDLLRMTITGVEGQDAERLNQQIDADADGASGAVRWSGPGGDGLYVLTYDRPASAC